MVLLAARAGVLGRLTRASLLADPADRHLGRARQRLHPGGHDRALRDRAVRRDRGGRRLRGPDPGPAGRDLASIGLFVLTTDPRAFVFDLERRGVSPRLAFVAVATIEAVPALVERAAIIGESQRARGLDTEGSSGPDCAGSCRSSGR